MIHFSLFISSSFWVRFLGMLGLGLVLALVLWLGLVFLVRERVSIRDSVILKMC